MTRRAAGLGVVLVALGLVPWAGSSPALAQQAGSGSGAEDARTASAFVDGLRERGLLELAADYLERVARQPDAPAELVQTADYELGRLFLDEAQATGDLVRQKDLLDQARQKLDGFAKANPKHPKAADALVEMARILVLRGELAELQADDTEVKAEKDAKLAEARGAFDQAHVAYTSADDQLKAAFDKFPKFIPEGDPRKDERERVQTALLNAKLQGALVDYKQGGTYPPGSKERADLLGKALAQFDDLHKRYRQQLAGFTAQMWQAKCYEERGELGPAMGIYNELLQHEDPRLRGLQRFVGYFRIIVLGKRKEYALAADEAVRYLQAYNAPAAGRSKEALGVRLELAKDILAQLPGIEGEKDKVVALKRVTEVLSEVVRYSSPFKAEAVSLLKKYKPSAAANATDVARLNYEDAISEGEQTLGVQDYDRAGALFRQAVRRAEGARDQDKTNYARHHLAFCYYRAKRFYECAVICDHLARRYPQAGLSPKSAEVGMAALAEAYNTYTDVDRSSDLNNLIDLGKYTAETYAETDQGDFAKVTLGQIYQGTGRYPEAIAAYLAVRPKSGRFVEAQTLLGGAYWDDQKALRRDNKPAEADAETAKALATLQAALKTRQDAGAPPADPGLLGNATDLAEIDLEVGKPADAVTLLEPLAAQPSPPAGAPFARVLSLLVRSHVAVNKVDAAMADMAALEKSGAGGNLTELYFNLGKRLESELDALKKKGDGAALNRTQASYLKFLTAVAESKSVQSFNALLWAGESMLKLGKPKEAEGVFNRALAAYGSAPKFQGDFSLRTRIGLASSLRDQGKFGEAESMLAQLIQENPRSLELMMARGYLLDAQAAAKKGTWSAALAHWQKVALAVGKAKSKPPEYYEAWYHAALALKAESKPKEAKQTLASVMRLSPSLGGPEMKQKYKSLYDAIK